MLFYFWKFVHHSLVHPLLGFPWDEPRWLNRLHNWTADAMGRYDDAELKDFVDKMLKEGKCRVVSVSRNDGC